MKPSKLYSSPKQWLKGDYAKDGRGASVFPLDVTACKWCLSGRIERCSERNEELELRLAQSVRQAIMVLFPGFNGIINFNDNRSTTYQDVEAVLQKADEFYAES